MSEPSPIDKEKHLRYWQRCFRTFLPTQYTSYDSTRMTLAFFILAAFDLLSSPDGSDEHPQQDQHITDAKRSEIRQWVLQLQHPAGGFCGSPSHALPAELCTRVNPTTGRKEGKNIEGANIAATSFALLILALVAKHEDAQAAFDGVDRVATLQWLRRLQRADGSFGELVLDSGEIKGGRDMRLCYLAATIRWCLRGDVEQGSPGWVEDIDVERLIGHIRRGQAYDGGMAESLQHESHAGYAYCATGALYLLDRPSDKAGNENLGAAFRKGVPDLNSLVKFLAFRQFEYLERPEEDEEDDPENANFYIPEKLEQLTLEETREFVGFNGRCNKVADTCYCWWVAGTLAMLPHVQDESIIAANPSRAFMLAKTQHLIGGFAKHPGGPPDIYHSYLGLAALATMGDASLKGFDPSLCVTSETASKIIKARQGSIKASNFARDTKHGVDGFWHGRTAVWPRFGIDATESEKLGAALEALG